MVDWSAHLQGLRGCIFILSWSSSERLWARTTSCSVAVHMTCCWSWGRQDMSSPYTNRRVLRLMCC